MPQAKYYIILFLVCLIWGATPASGKLTVEAFSPLMITGMRFLIMAIVLFAWLIITKDKKSFYLDKELLIVLLAMGCMGVLIHNGLLFTGLNYTTATNTALIESIGPTVTTILAFLFIGERLTLAGWIGIFVSCLGALCIVSKGSLDVLLNLSFNIGDIIILLCEIAWSCYVVISWRIHGRLGTIAVTAWSGLFGALMCFAAGAVTNSLHIYNVTTGALLGFAYLVIFSGIFAFVGWNYGAQGVGASKAGVFIYLVPLTGGIIGVLVLGETIDMSQIMGGALIIGGVVITVRSKVSIHKAKQQEPNAQEEDLLKKFPELAEEHNKQLEAAKSAAEKVKAANSQVSEPQEQQLINSSQLLDSTSTNALLVTKEREQAIQTSAKQDKSLNVTSIQFKEDNNKENNAENNEDNQTITKDNSSNQNQTINSSLDSAIVMSSVSSVSSSNFNLEQSLTNEANEANEIKETKETKETPTTQTNAILSDSLKDVTLLDKEQLTSAENHGFIEVTTATADEALAEKTHAQVMQEFNMSLETLDLNIEKIKALDSVASKEQAIQQLENMLQKLKQG